jgi:hypothetical protein
VPVTGASTSGGTDAPGRRKTRALRALLWTVAVLACASALLAVVQSLTFPFAVAKHPVRTEATITSVYINGLGGDPRVDYRYRVADRLYTGSGDGKLGDEPLLNLHPGDRVAIEYAANAPSESCTCDAVRERPAATTVTIPLAVVLSLPLTILMGRSVKRWRLNRALWFRPVRGFGAWIGFVGGILVAVAFVLVALAYLIAPSVGG